jgi:hypothetical protein
MATEFTKRWPWAPLVVGLIIFALLVSLVSWPWHQPAPTRASIDLDSKHQALSVPIRFGVVAPVTGDLSSTRHGTFDGVS